MGLFAASMPDWLKAIDQATADCIAAAADSLPSPTLQESCGYFTGLANCLHISNRFLGLTNGEQRQGLCPRQAQGNTETSPWKREEQ